MALTVLDCIEHIRHRLGTTEDGAGLSHGLSGLEVVNMAGMWLTTVHRWRWAMRQQATLDFVAGQNYLTLPDDFETIVDLETSNLTSGMQPTTLAKLLDLEKNVSGASTFYQYAVEYDHTAAVPTPRLRIWPTPDSSETGAVTIYYRAKWARRTDDNQTVYLPEFLHPLFIELVREYALGWEEADQVPLSERLAALSLGPLWSAAQSTDGLIQPSVGVLSNGIADAGYYTGDYWRFFEANGPS